MTFGYVALTALRTYTHMSNNVVVSSELRLLTALIGNCYYYIVPRSFVQQFPYTFEALTCS